MELQLGLALPILVDPINPEFDLNRRWSDSNQNVSSEPLNFLCLENSTSFASKKRKRSYEEAFGINKLESSNATLSLLLWRGQPNEEDDDPNHPNNTTSFPFIKDEEEQSQAVGWPPIKSWRKKQLTHQQQVDRQLDINDRVDIENGNNVKVKMEGVAIGRKIDLRLFDSYRALKIGLISMFAKYCFHQKWEKDDASFTLTYQDKDGDWLFAGDLPWQTFIQSVQRLKILRKNRLQ